MVANASDQFDFVRQLYQVIVGPHREGLAFDLRIFVGRENDDWGVFGRVVSSKLTDQSQTIDPGHDEVLQDHGRFDLVGQRKSFTGIGTVMEIDVAMVSQGAANGFTNHGLVIDQQYHDVVIGGMSGLFGSRRGTIICSWVRH